MAENGESPKEGIIKPWGDPALREPDINPHEAQQLRRKENLEKLRHKPRGSKRQLEIKRIGQEGMAHLKGYSEEHPELKKGF